jgi:hypothetical protein
MFTQPDLKEIERKAFRATYQDGLLDICISFVVGSMALMMFMDDREDYAWLYLLLAFLGVGIGQFIFWAGKKYITLPRMGQVKFGEMRRKRGKTLTLILAAVVVVQVAIVLLTAGALAIPAWGATLQELFPGKNSMDLLVAALSAVFVGPSMMAVAYFTDFPRGYYIALVMTLGVFLMVWYWQPLIQIGAAVLILIPGLILFVRFLRQYPPVQEEQP